MKDMLVASEILTTGYCPLNCSYCVTGDTKVLMADYTWKEIKDIKEGDRIIAVTEKPSNGRRRFVFADVLAKHERFDDVYEVELENGVKINITSNHPILGRSNKWMQIDKALPSDAPNKNSLKVGSVLRFVSEPVHLNTRSRYYKLGYVRGIIDGDGTYIDKIYERNPKDFDYLKKLGRNDVLLSISVYTKRVKVTSIKHLGKMLVYNLMTSSGTYISNGLISHNCYIPKTEEMKEVHLDIVKELKSKVRLMKMKEMKEKYGIKVEYLGAWGTEPLLTMNFIDICEWKREFPELKEFSYSTSMMIKPVPVISKVEECNKCGVNIRHQISLDGPPWITDVNRVGGSVDTIRKYTLWMLDELSKMDFDIKVEISLKPTWSIENIREMVEHPELIHEVFDFFNDFVNEMREHNSHENVRILSVAGGTLVVPGKYTSEDGKILSKFFEYLYNFDYPNNYSFRLARILDYANELHKARIFTCSAMDSQFGYDDEGKVHLCHRTYYFNKEKYIDAIMKNGKYDNWDVSVLEQGRMREINKYYIIPGNDEFEMWRLYYVMRGYHDFWRMRLAYVANMAKVLAMAGQAEERFLYDDDYTLLFSLFMNSAFSCPMENLLNTGSVHLTPVSLIRYLGNGAFYWIAKSLDKMYRERGLH